MQKWSLPVKERNLKFVTLDQLENPRSDADTFEADATSHMSVFSGSDMVVRLKVNRI